MRLGLTRAIGLGASVATLALAAPATASATLAFVRGAARPAVWSASDDGSHQRRLAGGSEPHVSPDGTTVACMSSLSARSAPRLMLVPAAGGKPRQLASGWRDPATFAWSPDSGEIAAVLGPEVGPQRLVLIDVEDGARRTLARGYFDGVSFSPDGESVVYAVARSERYPPRANIYRAAVAGGAPVAITRDGRSLDPLWGPTGRIVFVRLLDAAHRRYGPKNELFTMSPAGAGARRLTHTVVGPLVQGLVPTQWSASGSRLLAEFVGQDTSYPVTVSPRTGAQHALRLRAGFVATALSADGARILGYTGFLGPGPHNVASVPYGGGRPTVLVRNALEPSWNG